MNLFAGFGKRQVLLALGFCIPIQAAHLMYALLEQKQMQLWLIGVWIVLSFFFALLGLACAVATDNALGDSVGMAMRLVVALIVAASVMTVVSELLVYVMPAAMMDEEKKLMGDYANVLHRIAFRFVTSGDTALLLIPLYMMMQANRRASARLHDARLAALTAERNVVESDLRAMQGRVDPELLFDTLLEVDRAYERSAEEGQEALDALIRFLRAALPGDAAATATVAGEQELAEAYLALLAHRTAPHPQVDISVAPEARMLHMPAMLLLPLVRWALDSATQLEIRAQRRDAGLEVSVRSNSNADSASAEPGIAGVRERLTRLFADTASLDVSVSADARQARLLIPAS